MYMIKCALQRYIILGAGDVFSRFPISFIGLAFAPRSWLRHSADTED